MNLEMMKQKYAYTLARVGLNVQKGQIVLVEAAIEAYEFTSIFAEECYKLGASNVIINYLDDNNLKVRAKYVDEKEVSKVDDVERAYYQYYLDQGACYIRLEGVNPKLMEDVSEKESNAIFNRIDAIRNIMRKASRTHHCQWLIAMVPTKQWADYIMGESDDKLTDLWKLLFKLCYIDEENDVVATWKDLRRKKNERGNKIDALKLTKLHYTSSNGTDLTVELTPYSKFGHPELPKDAIEFVANIPTEEICTTPEKYGTNGVVYATRPLVLGGKKIENFGFRFEKGKVVEVLATEGKDMLLNLINTDENAGYLGECALVEYHSPISMSNIVYYTTLIDENASCHLALGRGLGNLKEMENTKWTFNDSTIHVDFMIGSSDMKIVGIDVDGKEVLIFENGDFAF